MSVPALLAIKIGNTNIGLGVFASAQVVSAWRIETRLEKTTDEYATDLFDLLDSDDVGLYIKHVAICSVVPALTQTIADVARVYLKCEPFVVGPGVSNGIRVKYEDPRALGADRLVAMVAAKARYGVPAIVVDIGTATTFNVLNAEGDFIGGAIAPGPNIQAQALHLFTAKLPRVEIAVPAQALSTNTRDALRAGLFFGYVGQIEGLIGRLVREAGVPQAHVIATGGLAPLVAPHCPSIQTIDTGLGLEGIRILFDINKSRSEN